MNSFFNAFLAELTSLLAAICSSIAQLARAESDAIRSSSRSGLRHKACLFNYYYNNKYNAIIRVCLLYFIIVIDRPIDSSINTFKTLDHELL